MSDHGLAESATVSVFTSHGPDDVIWNGLGVAFICTAKKYNNYLQSSDLSIVH